MDGQERGWLAASRQTRCSWHTCPVRARWSAGKEARWRADGRHCWQCLWVRRKWREGLWFQLCCLNKLNCYTLTKVWDSCLSEPVNVSQLSSSTSCVWAAAVMVRILHMGEGEQLRNDQIPQDYGKQTRALRCLVEPVSMYCFGCFSRNRICSE